ARPFGDGFLQLLRSTAVIGPDRRARRGPRLRPVGRHGRGGGGDRRRCGRHLHEPGRTRDGAPPGGGGVVRGLSIGLDALHRSDGAARGAVHVGPRRTRAGFTMNYFDPQGSYRLLTTVEGQWPSRGTGGGSPFLVLGVEGGVVKPGLGLLARVGYVGHSVTTAAAPFTWGGSLELGRLHLAYAYRADD